MLLIHAVFVHGISSSNNEDTLSSVLSYSNDHYLDLRALNRPEVSVHVDIVDYLDADRNAKIITKYP
ncbi:hypothetical protein J2Z48_002126 [Croceifilum oryzae]|uniref:Uncharacterized protein n=1 Tax=Croceifilum oryzae TaxID=1553429 RepID=A0AAJ1WQW1_9BACL|nr:hypothetical protein [Croceifilum oryzae]